MSISVINTNHPDSFTVCNGEGLHLPFLLSPPIITPRFTNSCVGSRLGNGVINVSFQEHNLTSKNCYSWSENVPQNSGTNEIGSRTAENEDLWVLITIIQKCNTIRTPMMMQPWLAMSVCLQRYRQSLPSWGLHSLTINRRVFVSDLKTLQSIGGFIPSHPIPVCSTSTLKICGVELCILFFFHLKSLNGFHVETHFFGRSFIFCHSCL